MKKIKIKFIFEIEYEPIVDLYPEGSTIEDMLKIDLESSEDDPFFMIEHNNAERDITGEII